MKKLLTAITCFSLLTGAMAISACPHNDHAGTGDKAHQCPLKQKQNWSAALKLEGEKAAQVNQIQAQFKEQRQQLMSDHKAKIQALKASQKAALQGILTEQEVQQLESQWSAKMDHGHHPKGKQCDHHKAK